MLEATHIKISFERGVRGKIAPQGGGFDVKILTSAGDVLFSGWAIDIWDAFDELEDAAYDLSPPKPKRRNKPNPQRRRAQKKKRKPAVPADVDPDDPDQMSEFYAA